MEFNGGTYENVALKKNISSPNSFAQPSSPDSVWNAQIDFGEEYVIDRVRIVADPIEEIRKVKEKAEVDVSGITL